MVAIELVREREKDFIGVYPVTNFSAQQVAHKWNKISFVSSNGDGNMKIRVNSRRK